MHASVAPKPIEYSQEV